MPTNGRLPCLTCAPMLPYPLAPRSGSFPPPPFPITNTLLFAIVWSPPSLLPLCCTSPRRRTKSRGSHLTRPPHLQVVLTSSRSAVHHMKHQDGPLWSTSGLASTSPSLGVWERGFSQVVTQLHQLTGSISPAYDRYVQYLHTEANSLVLNHIGGGYSLKGDGFPHTTPRSSQPTILPFPPKGPVRSPIYSKSIN
jgi:hypothetical protein